MRLFITGARGFVGRELLLQCKRQGIDTVAVDISESSDDPDCQNMDIGSRNIANILPENVDAVIHLAGLTRDPDCRNKGYDCFNSNVMATLNLINAAETKNAKQFIFASTEWVYTNFDDKTVKDEESFIDITKHKSEYALSKLVSEANLRQKFQHGFCDTTCLRFGIIYGPRKANWSAVESIFHSVRAQDKVTVGCLRTARCFIHVSDITSGILKTIGIKGFNIINLQGNSPISLGEIIEAGKKLSGRDPEVNESSPESPSIRNVSNKKAKETLKWEPVIDLETGLRSLSSR